MKRGPQKRDGKKLSVKQLLLLAKVVFDQVPDPKGKDRDIRLADSLMSALAMFGLKSPSLLAFDHACNKKTIRQNLSKLYLINRIPSDTYMREELDEADPESIRDCFCTMLNSAQRYKLLERYRFLDGYLILTDGTGMFSSNKVHCKNCCEKNHHDGSITYHHSMLGAAIVHPELSQVIPLCPEPINKQDGTDKNDCERRAMQRLLPALKKEHPRLRATIVSDALSANAPQINEIKSFEYNFIINVKPGNNKALFDFISGITLPEVRVVKGKNSYTFRYINNVPLNDSKDAPLVNFLECKAIEVYGKKIIEKTFTWVTDHLITDDNVYLLMQGGRARWKIENETFNTLKNQGYQFEHNFGHGKKNLTTVFMFLMVLAFLIDQIQEAACGLFQAALQASGSRRALWEHMRSFFYICFLDSWEELFNAIGQDMGVKLERNTS